MKKLFTLIPVLLVLFLAGCVHQSSVPTVTCDPTKVKDTFHSSIHIKTLEDYQKYGPPNKSYDYTYPRNFVFYNNIRSLGSFVSYLCHTWQEGNHIYSYELMDSNYVEFELTFSHNTGQVPWKLVTIPANATSMAKIDFGSETAPQLRIDSNGISYNYVNGELYTIRGDAYGIAFTISRLDFQNYPEDGERTLLSLLLSTSSSDQRAAMRMIRRCLPKPWTHYALYCAVPVVILAIVAVLIYRKKRKSAAPSAAGSLVQPDQPLPPAPDTP